MSDSPTSTPPKPKPGSLRDRIAAFENKAAANTVPERPPPPRPRPSGFANWKPKQPSPPASPGTSTASRVESGNDDTTGGVENVTRSGPGGMNVVDAKESIARVGGSLKERMAALQGRGGFGASAAPSVPAPKPVVERPKWKPPPQAVTQPAAGEDDEENSKLQEGTSEEVEGSYVKSNPPSVKSPPPILKSPPPIIQSPLSEDDASRASGEGGGQEYVEGTEAEPEQIDEDEEERQRRAALAARMARLGGARIGMSPPIYGRPAVPPPTKKPSLPTPALELGVESPKVAEETPTEPTQDPPETSPRPPVAMPMTAIPKRAAPPRRKPAKSTSTGAIASPDASPVPPAADAPVAISLEEGSTAPVVPIDDVTIEKIVAGSDTVEAHDTVPEATEVSEGKFEVVEGSPITEEEEDEEARKKRVAEKLAKMGGINPFALPSVRRPSVGSTASAESFVASPPLSPPIPMRKPTLPGSPRPASTDKPLALKRASGGSVKSFDAPAGADVLRRASVGSVASIRSTSEVASIGRRPSVGSVRSITKQEGLQDVQGIVEEPESIVPEDDANASVHAPTTQTESNESGTAKDENDERNAHEDKKYDEDTQYDERTSNDEDDEDFETTPQQPPRVPHVVSSLSQQERTRGRVDPSIIASVFPPPPLRSPPVTLTPIPAIRRTTDAPLPPRIVPSSRDHSTDRNRLSGPAPPRRIVPQTPEQSARDLDDLDASASEEETGSELAQSALFVPPPVAAGTALRTVLSADDSEESELPLRVPPPPGSARFVSEGRGRPGTYEDTDVESNASGVALPVRINVALNEDISGATKLNRPLPSALLPFPSPPAPPAPVDQDSGSDYGDDASHEQDHETRVAEKHVLHARPLSGDSSQSISSSAADIAENIPLIVPPRLEEGGGVRHAPVRSVPPPPPGPLPVSPSSSSRQHHYAEEEEEEKEVLNEDEGDPIDPVFHSPSRRASYLPGAELEQTHAQATTQVSQVSLSPSTAAMRSPPSVLLSPPASASVSTSSVEPKEKEQVKSEDDEDKGRKQTIAERMARLGGIKFGAAPGLSGRPPVSVPPPRKASSDEPVGVGEGQDDESGHEKVELTREYAKTGSDQDEDEEEERARRERIASKLAGMGGMRIGMMPMAMPPRQSHVLGSEPQQSSLATSVPCPQVSLATKGSEASESSTSEDGVRVDVEESEIEEVEYEEAKEGSEEGSGEEVPPPPPPRIPIRRGTGASASSGPSATSPTSPNTPMTRPPVPVPGPFRRASTQSTGSTKKSQQPVQAQPSDYVLIDDPQVINEGVEGDASEQEGVPPPPPARPPHRAPLPARAAPPAPPPLSLGDSISSQWELPVIPSSSFSGELSTSWSEALIDEHQPAPPSEQNAPVPVPPPHAVPVPRSPEAMHLNSEELMAVWGRVGVQICEVATTMHDHSKKSLIGDGTYRGFVDAVLREVPNAAKPQSKQIPYGYLVYLQNGVQVQKRASEILPGDIVEIVDARFKGHKGLGGYQQHVGHGVEGGEGGGPVTGVICEFELKKSKVRVFQANQHVGQQTVESVSYRLDDLKSGLVKVYRALEA